MAPASIVLRLTTSLVAGFELYAFAEDGSLPEVTDAIGHGDYPGDEFYIGGKIVRDVLSREEQAQLRERGAHLYRLASHALDAAARQVTGVGFLNEAGAEVVA
jgi:CRISPR-associated protein Cst2